MNPLILIHLQPDTRYLGIPQRCPVKGRWMCLGCLRAAARSQCITQNNPRAQAEEVRDHVILNPPTRLIINRLHLIPNTEEQGLSLSRWPCQCSPVPSLSRPVPPHNAAIAKIAGLKAAPTGCISSEEMNGCRCRGGTWA